MKTVFILSIIYVISAFTPNQKEINSKYKVQKLISPPEVNAKWDKLPWSEIEPILIQNYMGNKPDHFPFTQVKMAYDDSAVYVIFRVEDRYVKAVQTKNQDPVCTDSCVEFFFIPGGNIEDGYFNLEMNCGGVMLFQHQMTPQSEKVSISDDDIKKIEVAHTLPKIVEPEIEEKTTWVVEYRIPFLILDKYVTSSNPQSNSVWRANFYKCADKTSHPHWLTWAPVYFPSPRFHLPQFFGILEFK